MLISYLHRYLRDNTYVGKHYNLYSNLTVLKNDYPSLQIVEGSDRQTFTLTLTDNDKHFDSEFMSKLTNILKQYNNYEFTVRSENRLVFKVKFGWLPPNAGSWLNLLNSENIIDYYIDGITLRPNTHTTYGSAPDSGFVCYKINNIQEYDTIMFLINESVIFDEEDEVKFTFASLLDELEGSKGATLNRIVETVPVNAYYEVGPYNTNYLTAEEASLIIQMPYKYAISEGYYVYDVGNSVSINPENNPDNENDPINWFVPFDAENFDDLFIRNDVDSTIITKIINSDSDLLGTTLDQYLLGDFIWKTSDSKLIAYAQNLINRLFNSANLKNDGVWTEELSNYIRQYKQNKSEELLIAFDDDIIDKITEEALISDYKREYNSDPNYLFNDW